MKQYLAITSSYDKHADSIVDKTNGWSSDKQPDHADRSRLVNLIYDGYYGEDFKKSCEEYGYIIRIFETNHISTIKYINDKEDLRDD